MDEFYALVNKLGGNVLSYKKLLEKGTTHWLSPNEATNESGFTALPGGHFREKNGFWGLKKQAVFVSSSPYPDTTSTSIMVLNLNQNFLRTYVEGSPRGTYYSIRCIKK